MIGLQLTVPTGQAVWKGARCLKRPLHCKHGDLWYHAALSIVPVGTISAGKAATALQGSRTMRHSLRRRIVPPDRRSRENPPMRTGSSFCPVPARRFRHFLELRVREDWTEQPEVTGPSRQEFQSGESLAERVLGRPKGRRRIVTVHDQSAETFFSAAGLAAIIRFRPQRVRA